MSHDGGVSSAWSRVGCLECRGSTLVGATHACHLCFADLRPGHDGLVPWWRRRRLKAVVEAALREKDREDEEVSRNIDFLLLLHGVRPLRYILTDEGQTHTGILNEGYADTYERNRQYRESCEFVERFDHIVGLLDGLIRILGSRS
jgi:hypothetical protein